jgi:hypothetical protein
MVVEYLLKTRVDREGIMEKDRLVLFVHGLGGAGEATWRDGRHPGFAQLIKNDGALRDSTDVAFFEYPTSLLRLPFTRISPRVGDLAEGLRSQIENRFPNHRSIALICHSLGGLVARRYLIEEVKRGNTLRVDKLLLYAVPNTGSNLAGIAQHISWRHNQLRQLCLGSEFLEEINKEWTRLKMNESVTVRYVFGGQDRVVDKQSAVGIGNELVDPILEANHKSIVKPRRHKDMSYLLFRRFVLGPAPVYLSVGSGRTEKQDAFVEALKRFLSGQNLDAKTAVDGTNRQPLKDVEYTMKRCFGAIVLAFERTRIEVGVSRPGAKLERKLKDVRLPTIWNQIEAAMAYTCGLPLLVLVENGLQDEGVLESRYDWRVKWVDLQDPIESDRDFRGMFEHWRENVIEKRDVVLNS